VSTPVTLAQKGDRFEHKQKKEHPIDDVDDDVDKMVSRELIAVEVVVQAETDIDQGPVAGKTLRCTVEKLRERKRPHRVKVALDVDDVVHVKRRLQGMTVQDHPKECKN
jgi:hypothetical protein